MKTIYMLVIVLVIITSAYKKKYVCDCYSISDPNTPVNSEAIYNSKKNATA